MCQLGVRIRVCTLLLEVLMPRKGAVRRVTDHPTLCL
jgi:hypothetical protein